MVIGKEGSASKGGHADGGIVGFIARNCNACGSCLGGCAFLERHGAPGRIATQGLAGSPDLFSAAFACSLCGWCEETCPQGLPVAGMFLELRRQAVRAGRGRFLAHLPLLWYEALGSSPLLTGYFLPAGCTTVLFPGCALPGLRPRVTYRLFRLLQQRIPNLGLVFDCCGKPSHDLGRQGRFEKELSRKIKAMRDYGVKRIVTACPSCLQIFRRYGHGLVIEAVYSHLGDYEFAGQKHRGLGYTLHDPCAVRDDPDMHRAVRQLMAAMGLPLTEMAHNREKTYCCGKGGAAVCSDRNTDRGWRQKRLAEAGGLNLVTYCAGCTEALAAGHTFHLFDLLLDSPGGGDKAPKAVKPPRTYLNRLYLKLRIKISSLLGRV